MGKYITICTSTRMVTSPKHRIVIKIPFLMTVLDKTIICVAICGNTM